MTNIILCGCNGKMGQFIVKAIESREDTKVVCGVDSYNKQLNDFPVYKTFDEITENADAIIDFSNPDALSGLLSFAVKNSVPAVICTTGLSNEQKQEIKKASESVALFQSGNMSLGINLLIELAKKAATVLNGFDIEIIEKHHNQKIDAPSGTALMIADEVSTVLEKEPQYVYDRHSYRRKRSENEIGIHAVRGGTIVGEHDIIFAGHDEVVTISHQAQSKEVFAVGSVNAAVFLSNQKPGMYDMSDLLNTII